MKEDETDLLKSLLCCKRRHSNYQRLPPTLPKEALEVFHDARNPRLDEERYDWINSNCMFSNKSVLEIGANIGYFSSRIAKEFTSTVYAYEPDAKLYEILKNVIRLSGLAGQVIAINKPVTLGTIGNLPHVDIILNLNVAQHAGYDFDSDLISSVEDWRKYTIKYLKKLRNKGDIMVFQMGYRLWGFDEKICKEHDIINYTVKLLKGSGWRPKSCGVLKSLPHGKEIVEYINYDLSTKNEVPIRKHNLPLWYIIKVVLSKIVNKPYIPYRFAQRPLFICESMQTRSS